MKRISAHFSFGLLALIPNFALAQPDPLLVSQNHKLFFPAAALTTNGISGLTNHAPHLMVSGVSIATAQGGNVSLVNTQVWVRRYDAQYGDWAWKVVVDQTGNICVAGESGSVSAGNDLALVKYSADGTQLWTNRYDGPSHNNEREWTAAVDGADNIYAAGQSINSDNSEDIVTIKYSSSGTAMWTNRYNRTGSARHDLTALAVDVAGNAHLLIHTYDGDIATLKYDTLGTALWTNYFKVGNNSTAAAIALSSGGDVYVLGTSWGGFLPGFAQGASTFKIAPDGTTLWTNFFYLTPIGLTAATDIVVDKFGNAIITAYRNFPQKEYIQVKYATDGAPLWTNLLTASILSGGPYSPQLEMDVFGNAFAFGISPGASGSEPDVSITKLSGDGVPLWTNRYYEVDSSGQGYFLYSAVNNAGDFYLAAQVWVPAGQNANYSTVKISANGAAVWTNHFDFTNGYDTAHGIAVDDAGGVYVTGVSSDDYATVKYADYISYTPPLDFVGTDSFTFTVVDNFGNTVTNTATVAVQPAPLQFNIAPANFYFSSGGLHLQVDGAQGSNPVILYASPDLVGWQSIATNAPFAGSAVFVDDTATTIPKRFYRAVQQQ